MDRKQQLYLWLATMFVAALLTADLIGGKFFRLGSVDLSVGMLAFPLTFVLTDVLNEFYGPSGARRVTFLGLGAAIFAFTVIQVAIALPTSPESPLAETAFATVFGWSARLYVASLTAYMLGQLLDITLFGLFRRLTRHRMLWLRATGSTLASQLLDTVVVNAVLLGGPQAARLHRRRGARLLHPQDRRSRSPSRPSSTSCTPSCYGCLARRKIG